MASTRVRSAVATSIASGALVPIPMELERWDDEGLHSNVTNNSRLTIVTAGDYRIGACAGFAASGAGFERRLYIRLNGTTLLCNVNMNPRALAEAKMAVATDWRFAAGDYIEAILYQDTGGAINQLVVAGSLPELWAMRYA